MPELIKRQRLDNILKLSLSAPEEQKAPPDFMQDNQCMSALKDNRGDSRVLYDAIAAEAYEKGIPMRVSELRGNGPIKVYTVFISPEITETQINDLSAIASVHFERCKAEQAAKAEPLRI